MPNYVRNRRCPCVRCRTQCLFGPAILITLGILFLLDTFWIVPFGKSFPVLLIVIGLLLFASRSGSTEGHVEATWMPRSYAPPPEDQQQPGPGSQQQGDPHR